MRNTTDTPAPAFEAVRDMTTDELRDLPVPMLRAVYEEGVELATDNAARYAPDAAVMMDLSPMKRVLREKGGR